MSTRQRSNSSAPRDSGHFASDRSPLQKVETIVGGMRREMSKEEKRNRMLEAEEKHAARRGKAPGYDGQRDDGYIPAQPPQPRSARTASNRTDYDFVPEPTARTADPLGNPDAARHRRADLQNGAAPIDYDAPVRSDGRRRSDGVAQIRRKPLPQDSRAVSDSYAQVLTPERSVREGRVFDADPDYVNGNHEARMPPDRRAVPNGHEPRDYARNGYAQPPASAGGQQPAGMVGRVKSLFQRPRDSDPQVVADGDAPGYQEQQHHHHLGHLHHQGEDHDRRFQPKKYRDYRKNISTARVAAEDASALPPAVAVAAVSASTNDQAWWERQQGSASRGKRGSNGVRVTEAGLVAPVDGGHEVTRPRQEQTFFQPQLYLKCGPLLRFTGIRKSATRGKEVWTGSIMIVTVDSKSHCEQPPILRIFKQPVDLLPPPPQEIDESSGQQLSPEYVDPIAGQVKMSRVGKTLYVKPVEQLEQGRDLSRVEDDSGLFEEHRSQPYQLPSNRGTTGGLRRVNQDGELRGKFQDIPAYVLNQERGATFWKWNLEVELGDHQTRIAYRINHGPAIGFWVPARGETMNMMFHSCNGFSASVNPNEFSGPDPLWRDVLNTHQTRPFHVMLGGGDQIYMDAATTQTKYFGDWSKSRNPHYKHNAPFSAEMQDELEKFYLNRYSMWFSQGLFGMANSQIPMVNMWDDHDIIDGFGSYPDHTMSSPVMSGVGNVAFKYYMLFQHQSLPLEDEQNEPSWLLGAQRGPYINELSRSLFMWLGKSTAFLGLDCRTERARDEILTQETWDRVFDRLSKELVKGQTRHLLVMLGVPIAYPRLNFLENVLTSRIMDPVKALGRTGALGGFVNKFDGGVEILDDLDDHWTAKHHKGERNWFIEELQELAAEKSVRVTILSGDVHLAAVGQFYSNKALHLPKDQDHRYMPNVISSAIVNTPPSDMVADALNKRNKVHHLNDYTDEDMIAMFHEDVNDKARNNKHLLPRRNWCSIREYRPETTPPPSLGASSVSLPYDGPNKRRSLADALPGAGIIRRLSSRAQRSSYSRPPMAYSQQKRASQQPRRHSIDALRATPAEVHGKKGPQTLASDGDLSRGVDGRPNPFLRRPTSLLPDNPDHLVNLKYGLDIRINCENERGDPAGITTPYRLIVPALDYRGRGDPNPEAVKPPEGRLKRLLSIGQRRDHRSPEQDYYSQESVTPSQSAPRARPQRRHVVNDSFDSLYSGPTSDRRRTSLDSQRRVRISPPSGGHNELPPQARAYHQQASAAAPAAAQPSMRRQQPAANGYPAGAQQRYPNVDFDNLPGPPPRPPPGPPHADATAYDQARSRRASAGTGRTDVGYV